MKKGVNDMATYPVEQVAEWFLRYAEIVGCDDLSNLKLQKLLYYAQSAHLAEFNGEPLFSEPILAWNHGPVVESIWRKYTKYGNAPIPADKEVDLSGIFEPADETELEQVFELFGQYSPWSLRNRTHDELPWKSTPRNHVIAPELMREYFSENYL